MQKDLISERFKELQRAIILLRASVKKFKPYRARKTYTPAEMEYYDSLSFRFEKTVELFLHFFKGLESFLFGKVSDTLRDRLFAMQKLNLIDTIDFWIEARLLRNKVAHDYLPEQLKDIYNEIHNKSKSIIKNIVKIEKYLNTINTKG
jgi:hypothetical protein